MEITVAFPSTLGRSEAVAFRNQLLVALEQKERVSIDCAACGPLPAVWIQMLHSAALSANKLGLSVTLKALSSDCLKSLNEIGFDSAKSHLVLE